MKEISKNVYVSSPIAHTTVDPWKWLDDYDTFPVRFVGGLHNISHHDKHIWVKDNNDLPLRIVETGTGREEIRFSHRGRTPDYICLDGDGNLTSHLKYTAPQPTLFQSSTYPGMEHGLSHVVEVYVWYHDNKLHRPMDKPAVVTSHAVIPVKHVGIRAIGFELVLESWEDGEWQNTTTEGEMDISLSNPKHNTPKNRQKAIDWLGKHCNGGFFPLAEHEDDIFGDIEEEFMFIADICS
jgi:hypothetical protein